MGMKKTVDSARVEPTKIIMEKAFIFLYPQQDIFDFEMRKGWEEQMRRSNQRLSYEDYKREYAKTLNECINNRYRKQGFQVYFALLDNTKISDIVEVREEDKIIFVGIDENRHRTRGENGEFTYPDQESILKQLGNISSLRIAGFHTWDCVERLAVSAYRRLPDVLVDEDLTEFLADRMLGEGFRKECFPNYDPKKDESMNIELFLEARRDRPWLWQY